MTAFVGSKRDGQRGQGLVEFALVIPLLLLLLFAILDFGRAVYAYSTISNQARAGSRVAIVDQTIATIEQTAIDQGVALGTTGADIDVCFKDAASTQQDCAQPATQACPTPRFIGCIAIVTVHHSFTAVTPVIGNIVGQIDMASTTRIPIERVFP